MKNKEPCTNIVHNDAVSNLSFTLNVTISLGLSCLFFQLIPSDVCRFSLSFFCYSHCSTGRDVVAVLFRKVSQDPSFLLHFFSLVKRWQNFQLAILLFCPGYYTSGDSSKNWEVREFQKRKQLRQLMSTFGFPVYVTYQCLHHRPGLEASAGGEGFDAASFFCTSGRM